MIAAALLHPDVSPKAVEPFRNTECDIQIQASLDSEHYSAALIFGGDGTIHRHLPQLHKYKLPALVVPRGSGNDFAKALGIANEETALRAWKVFCSSGKNLHEIDLGIVKTGEQETFFCCVVGAGLDSAANLRANQMPAWLRGSAGYFIAALQALASFQPVEIAVIAGTKEIRRPSFFVAVGNAHSYGRGMKVVPRAQLDDDLLDVCLVGKMSKLKLLFCLPTVFFGAHVRIKQVEYFQAPAVRIETGRPLEVYADGEYAGKTPIEISLLPRVLKVIVPA